MSAPENQDNEDEELELTSAATLSISAFPNIGVSLEFLTSFAESPDLDKPMYQLARPDLTPQALDTMDNAALRQLSKELGIYHHLHLPKAEELALYDDVNTPDQNWRDAVSRLPTTTAEVGISLIKPRTSGTGVCYATPRPSFDQVARTGWGFRRTFCATHGSIISKTL